LTDILSDADGVALHRLQIVVWTVILGVVFFAEIFRSFRLPTFDSNLLILMGISGATYVGFKFKEK
jgi:cation transport ATPase